MSNSIKDRLNTIVFGTDTKAGKTFDIVLLVFIILSVMVVFLETVEVLEHRYKQWFTTLEWAFTILFTIEYLLRLYITEKPLRYARSFYGLVDLFSIVPTYLSLILVGSHYMLTIRALRLLRVFRVFKLGRFLFESQALLAALKASRVKISVFLGTVLIVVIILGSLMYVIESPYNEQFSSIPKSMYWTVVTMTTVGFGDMVPQTIVGQFVAAMLMILGYGMIAVPTGIVSVEMAQATRDQHKETQEEQQCPSCKQKGIDPSANYCAHCGTDLSDLLE